MSVGFSAAHDFENFHQQYQLNQNMRTIPMQAQQFRPIQRSHSTQPTIKPSYLTVQRLISQLNNDYLSQSTSSSPQSSVPAFPSQQCISIQRQEVKEQPTSPDSARYKTELCRPFEETGQCRYGTKCQFAHGKHEMRGLNRHPRYKTELCRTYHTTGFCSYGQRCNFIHNEDERRTAPTTQRPPVLPPLVGGSTGVSPAGSINGDFSPSLSPSLSNDDVFSSFSSRLSPTPSFSSDTFSSPPGTPIELSNRSQSLTQQDILAMQVFQHLQKLNLH